MFPHSTGIGRLPGAILLVGAVLAPAAQPAVAGDGPAPVPLNVLQGRVLDSAGQQPVAGARVVAVRAGQGFISYGGEFVVVGISLDQDERLVKQFVEKRELPWPQVVLGPSEQNPVAKKYNVTAVPATFLIGRDGKVVAKDLTGRRLQRALGKQFPLTQQRASR